LRWCFAFHASLHLHTASVCRSRQVLALRGALHFMPLCSSAAALPVMASAIKGGCRAISGRCYSVVRCYAALCTAPAHSKRVSLTPGARLALVLRISCFGEFRGRDAGQCSRCRGRSPHVRSAPPLGRSSSAAAPRPQQLRCFSRGTAAQMFSQRKGETRPSLRRGVGGVWVRPSRQWGMACVPPTRGCAVCPPPLGRGRPSGDTWQCAAGGAWPATGNSLS